MSLNFPRIKPKFNKHDTPRGMQRNGSIIFHTNAALE